jgi:hypothetical protein
MVFTRVDQRQLSGPEISLRSIDFTPPVDMKIGNLASGRAWNDAPAKKLVNVSARYEGCPVAAVRWRSLCRERAVRER